MQLGKRAYKTYGEKLAIVINKMLLVSEVGTLSRRRSRACYEGESSLHLDMSFKTTDEASSQNPSQLGSGSAGRQSLPGSTRIPYNSLRDSDKQILLQQLEQWEEPTRAKMNQVSCQNVFYCFRGTY